jgi:Trypsin/PEP-CTERM motif
MKFVLKLVSAAVAGLCAIGSAQAVVSSTPASDWRLNPGDFGGAFDGVAKLLFSNSEGSFVCSGSLLSGGQYVLTAAHCADDFTSMTVDFKLGAVTANVVSATLHSGWTGFNTSVGNGSDIAILKLDTKITGISGFKLSTGNDLGKNILMAGYGLTGTGSTGDDGGFDRDPPGTVPRLWRPHFGYNTIDVTDYDLMEGVFGPGAGNTAYGETYVFDFDDGTAEHNALQRLKDLTGAGYADSSTGLGTSEALTAGGDSGGGDFYWDGTQWVLTGVHSYGWGLCSGDDLPNCDVLEGTNSSYGDLSGSTAVFSHTAWINSVIAVPEPETYALMLAGLGIVGWTARRRSRKTA